MKMDEDLRSENVIIHRDKAGNILHIAELKTRCMTKTGFAAVVRLLLTDLSETKFDYVAIGTSSQAATSDDTALITEIKRKAGVGTQVTITYTNDTAQLIATFSSADGLSGTSVVAETGMLNAASNGILLMRQVFTGISCNWDNGDSLEMTLKVQMVQGV